MEIQSILEKWALDSDNPVLNYHLGLAYENQNQLAGAVTFYLRAAEYGHEIESNKDMVYTCLLKLGKLFEKLGERPTSVKTWYHQAIAYRPDRPEAYFYASTIEEQNKNWLQCYSLATIGEYVYDKSKESTYYLVDLVGKSLFTFQKAAASWWIGRRQESIDLFNELKNDNSLSKNYKDLIEENLHRILNN